MDNRISKLQALLDDKKCSAILISSPINIEHLTGFSNFSKYEREAYLFITKLNALLFTDARYIEAVEKIIPKEIKASTKDPVEEIGKIIKRQQIQKIGFEKNLTFAEYKEFKSEIEANFTLLDNVIEDLRSIKTLEEIEKIKKAARLTDKTFSYIIKKIKLGVSEKEIAWEIEKFIKENGGTLAFDTIAAFGANSSIPHHLTSNKKLTNSDQFILLDFGAKVHGYCSDMTRTILTKNAGIKAKKMYQTVFQAQENAAKSIISGKKNNAANAAKTANNTLIKAGFEIIPHGLGHGIGLEVHETPHLHPKSEDILTSGDYFSIEPGIYIPKFGGVRIEDDYLITKNKVEQITKSPKNLIEI
ncbi:MAG: Xaa-Pro dipeptidase [Candidatus Levybacteria bacterium CG10_big_fil_rev_8_21_14_0_10_36_7]|nr:MAG: Xaa-Pro dipeptidase [Candidatus Levybacteria bacterium CG10_big_fil_rev_8_21_14_0_10_36_7]